MAKKERGKIITLELFEEMINKLESGSQEEALLCLLYITGCRISEALMLKISDVTIDGEDIAINIPTLKTRKHIKYSYRTLFIGKNTPYLKTFIRYISNNTPADVFTGKIFGINRFQAWNIITRVSNNQFTCHDLRHSRATILAEKGYTAFQLQAWFGWRRMDMAERYVKLSLIAREVIKQMKDNIL